MSESTTPLLLNPIERPTWMHYLFALALGFCFTFWLAQSSHLVGVPRDESIYFYAGDRFADWFEKAVNGPSFFDALSDGRVKEGFEINHEHPMLMKALFGLSHRYLHQKWQWIQDPILAYRLPSMILAGLCIALTFLLGFRFGRTWVGLFAALSLMLMPHLFFHAHLSCFDIPVTFFWLLIVYSYLSAVFDLELKPMYIAWTGICLGLGLATKLNAFFAPFTLLSISLCHLFLLKKSNLIDLYQTYKKRYWLIGLSMVFLGLLVFWLHWPWLYHNTLFRWGAYIGFHMRHEHYAVDFFNHLYYRPPFPIYFPFAMSLFTLPMAILSLGSIGLIYLSYLTYQRGKWLLSNTQANPQTTQIQSYPWELLILANAIVPFLIIAMPSTPIFGGTKHWMPALPFVAISAGIVFQRLISSWQLSLRIPTLALQIIFMIALLLPALLDTLTYGHRGAMYYNTLIGGIPGAAQHRLPRNFWGYSTIDTLPYLNQNTEPNPLIFWHKATNISIHQYQRAGLARKDLQYTGDWTGAYADWGVYHDQREKKHEEVDLWFYYQNPFPIDGVFIDGVQMMGIYHR